MDHKENFPFLPELKKTDEIKSSLSDFCVHWKAGQLSDCSIWKTNSHTCTLFRGIK